MWKIDDKYTEKEKEFWRKDRMNTIKFFLLFIVVVSLGVYFFGDGNIDSSFHSDGNYRRP